MIGALDSKAPRALAFLTGISLILRATSRQIRRHLGESIPQSDSLSALKLAPWLLQSPEGYRAEQPSF
jgi:hypothetical protein